MGVFSVPGGPETDNTSNSTNNDPILMISVLFHGFLMMKIPFMTLSRGPEVNVTNFLRRSDVSKVRTRYEICPVIPLVWQERRVPMHHTGIKIGNDC